MRGRIRTPIAAVAAALTLIVGAAGTAQASPSGRLSADRSAAAPDCGGGGARGVPGQQIAVVDHACNDVRILNETADWNNDAASVVWNSGSLGSVGATCPQARHLSGSWDGISDAKLRTDRYGRSVILVAAGGGNVGSILYRPGSKPKMVWCASVTDKSDPKHNAHSIELLPDNSVVVATTDPGKVYFFPFGSTTYSKVQTFGGAHSVLYHNGYVWVLGRGKLQAFTEASDRRSLAASSVPAVKSIGGKSLELGHDLSPAYNYGWAGMWVSDSSRTYGYVDGQKRGWVQQNVGSVKSIGNQRDHTGIQTVGGKSDCSSSDYYTDTVQIYSIGKGWQNRTKPHACFYKARPVIFWWS